MSRDSHAGFSQALRWILKNELGEKRYQELIQCGKSGSPWKDMQHVPTDLFKAELIKNAYKHQGMEAELKETRLERDGKRRVRPRLGIDLTVTELRGWATREHLVDVLALVPPYAHEAHSVEALALWKQFESKLSASRKTLAAGEQETQAPDPNINREASTSPTSSPTAAVQPLPQPFQFPHAVEPRPPAVLPRDVPAHSECSQPAWSDDQLKDWLSQLDSQLSPP